MNNVLLTGQLVTLAAVNPDADADIIACWSRDSQFWRLVHTDPALPVLPRHVKQKLEERPLELQGFAIRTLNDDRLIGLIGLYTVMSSQREAFMGIQIGERDYWGKGYGTDALRALLRYGFDELNLQRVSLSVLEGNERAMRAYEKCGFRYEGHERQAWTYDGRRWDEIYMGLLHEEWAAAAMNNDTRSWSSSSRKIASMDSNLFTGQLVRLTAMNSEGDVEAFAHWDVDSEYLRQLDSGPQLPHRDKKIKENIEKQQSEDPNTIAFSVRSLAGDKLIGGVTFDGIDWQHGDTFVAIGIGEPVYRGKGYGTDAMRVMLRYGFMELNLHRVQLNTFSYNERAIKSYLKAGFVVEGRQRGMLRRDGQRWDIVYMSVLREEWLALNN